MAFISLSAAADDNWSSSLASRNELGPMISYFIVILFSWSSPIFETTWRRGMISACFRLVITCGSRETSALTFFNDFEGSTALS